MKVPLSLFGQMFFNSNFCVPRICLLQSRKDFVPKYYNKQFNNNYCYSRYGNNEQNYSRTAFDYLFIKVRPSLALLPFIHCMSSYYVKYVQVKYLLHNVDLFNL